MIKIDIISGFFGAGKTTFLNKYLSCFNEKIVVIENEFGSVGLDANLIEDDLPIKEINSGCICCSLQIDFKESILEIADKFQPDRIVIEPSGIAKLSDILLVCKQIKQLDNLDINIINKIVIIDASSFMDNLEDFGAFFSDQISNANLIFLNRFTTLTKTELIKVEKEIRLLNYNACLYYDDASQNNLALENIIASAHLLLQEDEDNNERFTNNDFNEINNLESKTIMTNQIFTQEDIDKLKSNLENDVYGQIIRAKALLKANNKQQWQLNYTPNHFQSELKEGSQQSTKLILIGQNLYNQEIEKI